MQSIDTRARPVTYRDNFDILRLLVAVLVMVRHCMTRLEISKPDWWWFVDVFPGVPIFFVISGYLVAASWERSRDLRSYALSRGRRIFPGLWACVLATVAVAAWFGFDFLHGAGFIWLATQLVGLIYTPGFLDEFGSGSYNGALWTIPVSLQFYVMLPLIYLLLARRNETNRRFLVLWLVAAVLALVFRPMLQTGAGEVETLQMKLLRYSIVPHLYLFLLGLLLHRYRVREWSVIRGKALYWLVGYLAAMYLLPASDLKDVMQPVALAFVAMSLAYTAPGITRGALRGHDVSYGLFIYHGLVINVFVELGLQGSPAYAWGVAAITLVIAWLSWRFIESPFLARRRANVPAMPVAGRP